MKMKIFTLLLCAFFVAGVSAQDRPTHEVAKVAVGPDVDGVVDELWNDIDPNNIDQNFQAETPTIGQSGESFWKMVWVEGEGIYLLLIINDDDFHPYYEVEPPGETWMYDKPEIYFDCNYILEDDGGASGEGQPGNGHHQCAPPFADGLNDGTMLDAGEAGEADDDDLGVKYAHMVNDPDYVSEYFFPMAYLTDKDGVPNDLSGEVGFDVTIIDQDEGVTTTRHRAVWANTGQFGDANESWNSMDECGILTFEGVGAKTYVESITLTAGDITENNLPLQIQAEVLPEDATTKTLAWTVENVTGRAKINSAGVLTPIMDGEVIVTAAAKDGSYVEESVTVNISGQIVSRPEINLIRNGYFDQVEDDGSAAEWSGTHQVYDGIVTLDPPPGGVNYWDFTMTQQDFGCNTEDMYTFSFVAWADEPDTFNVDFEDSNQDYLRYGISTHELSNGRSDWTFVTEVTPTKYVFDVQFVDKIENTNESCQFMLGLHDPVVYIDSIELINDNDLALLTEYKPVESIEVSADASTVATGGTLQMSAEVLPEDADYTGVRWSVEPGTGWASIDENGLLTGDTAGTVTVVASAKDDSQQMGTLDITVSWPEGIEQQKVSALKLYPNPAVNQLNVELPTLNATVSIYNSVGQKMEEVNVTGTKHSFDISSYAKGIYFVRTGDSVAKFIK